MATYRERREQRAEQLENWADSRDVKADAAYAGVRAIADRIPFGQPILVGHHSERGARADQRRMHNGMDRFSEHVSKAGDMRSRAENIRAQAAGAIYSDDPDALEQLAAKVQRLEAQRDAAKVANADYRKAHRAELREMTPFARDRAMPFPGYHLTNLGATIRATRKRLEQLQQPERGRRMFARYGGPCRACGADVEKGEPILWFRIARELEHESCPDR